MTHFKKKLEEFPFSQVHHCVLFIHTNYMRETETNLYRQGILQVCCQAPPGHFVLSLYHLLPIHPCLQVIGTFASQQMQVS